MNSAQTLVLLATILVIARPAWSQLNDSFEGGQPRWALVESDCGAQLTQHEISQIYPHHGRTSEMFEVACSDGTLVLLAYPIEPCTIIDEFQPSLWTRCSSGRLRLGLRVVFPFAAHPITGGRLTTVLWGDSYTDTGAWQALSVQALNDLLNDELVAIRSQFGASMRLDGAYIDCLVLNAYTGPGRYRVQLDDLSLRGMVPLAAIGQPPPSDWRERWRWRYAQPSREDRFWAAPNRPAVWLQYRQESLAWIKSLEFSGVVTSRLPSKEMLTAAHRAELGVISPPPAYAVDYPTKATPALSGWLLGAALDSQQSQIAAEQATRVASFPPELQKPLIAEALEDYFQYSRIADEVIVPQPVSSSAGDKREKVEWVRTQLATTSQRSHGWVSVNLGVPPTLADQLEAASELLEPNQDTESLSVDPLGFRSQVTSAVLAGARGFFFRTFRPLDIQNAADSAQLAALRWTQADLKLWGPWLVAGQTVKPARIDDPNWLTQTWSIEQSHLTVAQNALAGSQHCTPPTGMRPLTFRLTAAVNGQQAFRLTGGRLERLEAETTPAGMSWQLPSPTPTETILVTSNPRVLNFVRSHLSATVAQRAADQLEIVNHNMAIARRVAAARFPELDQGRLPSGPAGNTARSLAAAQRQIEASIQALQTQQAPAAIDLLGQASDTIQAVLFDAYLNATDRLATPQSSPLVVQPAALGLHWKLADACGRSEWRGLPLPGGPLSDLQRMEAAGWSQQRRLEERVELRVELVPSNQRSGLRMAAYARSLDETIEGGYSGASLRVRSAGVEAQAGQLVRISADARVLRANQQPGTGLLVYDNQVGPSLGQLVNGPEGQTVPVELYRFIAADGELRILAECRGECDIILENLTASVIEPATNSSRFGVRSLVPELFDPNNVFEQSP